MANTSHVDLDGLEFDSSNDQIRKLREDLEMETFQNESDAFIFIEAFLFYGTCTLQQPPTDAFMRAGMHINTPGHSLSPHEWSGNGQSDHSSPTVPVYDYTMDRPTGLDNELASPQWQYWSEGGSQHAMSLYGTATDSDMSAGTGPCDGLGLADNFFSSQDNQQLQQTNSMQLGSFTGFTGPLDYS
jgi:hypothetical protein